MLIWYLKPKDEKALDVYEGWPHLYHKETLRVTVNGKRIYAMIYIMNEDRHPYGAPSPQYFCTILTGYRSAGFDRRFCGRPRSGQWRNRKNNRKSITFLHFRLAFPQAAE